MAEYVKLADGRMAEVLDGQVKDDHLSSLVGNINEHRARRDRFEALRLENESKVIEEDKIIADFQAQIDAFNLVDVKPEVTP